jgi:C-5 cytosine-specific DNA methylase
MTLSRVYLYDRQPAVRGEREVVALAIDLFCGLGGWTEGLLATGWEVIGFDIEQHAYGDHRYPSQLVLQDVRTIHGRQFKDVDLIVGSSPCQEFSWRAMPWKAAKAAPPPHLGMELFNAQFRIQGEACEAAGRHIPMVVENVRGAQKWVGRSRWNYGSFHFWGDVPALMPMALKIEGIKVGGIDFNGFGTPGYKAQAFNPTAQRRMGRDPMWQRGFQATAADQMTRAGEHHATEDGLKIGGDWFSDPNSTCRRHGSKSKGRKMASAMIAKIPRPLSEHIGRVFYPQRTRTG